MTIEEISGEAGRGEIQTGKEVIIGAGEIMIVDGEIILVPGEIRPLGRGFGR